MNQKTSWSGASGEGARKHVTGDASPGDPPARPPARPTARPPARPPALRTAARRMPFSFNLLRTSYRCGPCSCGSNKYVGNRILKSSESMNRQILVGRVPGTSKDAAAARRQTYKCMKRIKRLD
ncbi:unnamed protein product, partial [Brenthis ino]